MDWFQGTSPKKNRGLAFKYRLYYKKNPFHHPTSAQSPVPGSVPDLKRRRPHVTQPKGAPIGHAGAPIEPMLQVVGAAQRRQCHIWHTLPQKSQGWSTCVPWTLRWCWCVYDFLSKSTMWTRYFATYMAVSVNVPSLRKLSNLLSGQWTSPHCTVRIFSPGFEAFAMSRQHGLRNASSFDEETNALGNTWADWADRFAQAFDQSKWGWHLNF